ncbi:hypothetical protein [Deinococcus cellulosilyticus]|uniref:Uncharacterized protein n=1 Tax=Deinococcus cellulosilyticus (strain DSM 18568 / NBRC 106333 / KACC 11606 / 5516J-15) TaxID=1223518 RepID=A0A511N9A7_DEIC1|nr:hypothetical protein [Deinococcus cellulosilyticus]GEM49414.1 hypothetical protein DC3_50490 [Deinococcus cellulosilyticus NBRC 106333 = KACC 11606]
MALSQQDSRLDPVFKTHDREWIYAFSGSPWQKMIQSMPQDFRRHWWLLVYTILKGLFLSFQEQLSFVGLLLGAYLLLKAEYLLRLVCTRIWTEFTVGWVFFSLRLPFAIALLVLGYLRLLGPHAVPGGLLFNGPVFLLILAFVGYYIYQTLQGLLALKNLHLITPS